MRSLVPLAVCSVLLFVVGLLGYKGVFRDSSMGSTSTAAPSVGPRVVRVAKESNGPVLQSRPASPGAKDELDFWTGGNRTGATGSAPSGMRESLGQVRVLRVLSLAGDPLPGVELSFRGPGLADVQLLRTRSDGTVVLAEARAGADGVPVSLVASLWDAAAEDSLEGASQASTPLAAGADADQGLEVRALGKRIVVQDEFIPARLERQGDELLLRLERSLVLQFRVQFAGAPERVPRGARPQLSRGTQAIREGQTLGHEPTSDPPGEDQLPITFIREGEWLICELAESWLPAELTVTAKNVQPAKRNVPAYAGGKDGRIDLGVIPLEAAHPPATGQVVLHDGTPLADTEYYIFKGDFDLTHSGRTDSDGRFEVVDIGSGAHRMDLDLPMLAGRLEDLEVPIESGGDVLVELPFALHEWEVVLAGGAIPDWPLDFSFTGFVQTKEGGASHTLQPTGWSGARGLRVLAAPGAALRAELTGTSKAGWLVRGELAPGDWQPVGAGDHRVATLELAALEPGIVTLVVPGVDGLTWQFRLQHQGVNSPKEERLGRSVTVVPGPWTAHFTATSSATNDLLPAEPELAFSVVAGEHLEVPIPVIRGGRLQLPALVTADKTLPDLPIKVTLTGPDGERYVNLRWFRQGPVGKAEDAPLSTGRLADQFSEALPPGNYTLTLALPDDVALGELAGRTVEHMLELGPADRVGFELE